MEKDVITKLGSSNYYAWSCQVEAVLDSKDLWDAVEDGWTEEELSDLTAEEKKSNKQALAFIKRTVEDFHLEYIGHLKSAKEAWDTLKTNFCERDALQQLIMMKELLRMEKDEKTPVIEYINKVISAHRELVTTGLIAFEERTIALIVLMGLPEEYSDCVRALSRDSKLSPKYIIPVLKAEEARIKMDKEDKQRQREVKGFVVKKQQQIFKPNQRQQSEPRSDQPSSSAAFNIQCFACHQVGHGVRDCQRVLNAKARGTVLCYSCGREGHSSKVCQSNNSGGASGGQQNSGNRSANSSRQNSGGGNYSKNNGGDQSKSGQDKQFKNSEVKFSENQVHLGDGVVNVKYRALMGKSDFIQEKENNEKSDPNRWCSDSGCNNHCTPYRELLENFTPVQGTMTVAKKQEECEVKGIGSVRMKVKDKYGGWTLELMRVLWVPDIGDNLISIRQLDKEGFKFAIDDGWLHAYDKNINDEEVFRAQAVDHEDDLYAFYVDWYEKAAPEGIPSTSGASNGSSDFNIPTSLTAKRAVTKELWHQRFAHAKNLPDKDIIPRGNCEECSVCDQGKAKKLPFPERLKKCDEVLDLVYSDVCFVQP